MNFQEDSGYQYDEHPVLRDTLKWTPPIILKSLFSDIFNLYFSSRRRGQVSLPY